MWKWERQALLKWESSLNFVHAHGNFANLDYRNFSTKKLSPCIIKIMCQGLPLGCLQCLLVCAVQNRNFGCSAWFYIFYWNVKWFWNLLCCLCMQNFYFVLIFQNFSSYISMVDVRIFTDCSVFTDCCYSFIICVCLNSCWSLLDLGP